MVGKSTGFCFLVGYDFSSNVADIGGVFVGEVFKSDEWLGKNIRLLKYGGVIFSHSSRQIKGV